MIRRDWPLAAVSPDRWVLISQPEHARLSGVIAEAWGGPNAPPLVCPSDEPDHSLAGARREFLAAVYHHDDGWFGYDRDPLIDPELGRPYSFTEMPTAESQRIWDASIEACRAIGPLAGWLVASHFHTLQSKRDGDYPEWIEWLARTDKQREAWLDEWLNQSEDHTRALADRCLVQLVALDWISLWLCCLCPALDGDRPPAEPLVVGEGETGWPRITFRPLGKAIHVTPWPFEADSITLDATAASVAVGRYRHDDATDLRRGSDASEVRWRLAPAGG